MKLTERIKQVAKKRGHTFASIERALCLSNASIRKWDDSPPSCEKLMKVADYLCTTMDFLMKGRIDGGPAVMDDDTMRIIAIWQALDEDSRVIIKGEMLKIKRDQERMSGAAKTVEAGMTDTGGQFY